jgi:transcriptional regulator with XRE-family HTH domain
MSDLKTLRESLGMPQDRMAVYLGISRSILAMVETGTRTLPIVAIERLGKLENTLKNLPVQITPQSHTELQRQAAEQRAALGKQSKNHRRQAEQAKLQLKQMTKASTTCLQSLKFVAAELAKLGNSEDDQLQRLNLELQQMETWKKLESCGAGAQGLLQVKIDWLTYAADRCLTIVF